MGSFVAQVPLFHKMAKTTYTGDSPVSTDVVTDVVTRSTERHPAIWTHGWWTLTLLLGPDTWHQQGQTD